MTKNHQAIIALIVANIIWGAASPIFKWSLLNIPPFTLAFLRFAIAACLLLPFTYNLLHIEKKDIKKIFLMAFFGVTINISFFFLALQNTASINAPIIASAAPIFIIFISVLTLKEHPRFKTIFGALIGLLGVLTIIGLPILANGFNLSVIGNLFLVIATLSGVAHIIISKKISASYNPLTITFYSFLIGSITFLPSLLYETTTVGFLPNLNMQGIVGIIYGAVFSSALAYFLLYWGLKNLTASEVGLFAYIDPVVAIIIAMPLLGEVPNAEYIIGSLLVFGGIYTAEGRINYHPLHKLKELF